MRKASIAVIAAAALLFTTSIASAQLCVFGIMAAAIYASSHDKRELTQKEAMSCGLMLGNDKDNEKPVKGAKKARTAKKPE
jgi:hypothetical protein